MTDDGHQLDPTSDRHETATERLDRNWLELLQELRVTQTGTQILTGFLLTLAFQQRFVDLDAYQVGLYLCLVVLAALTTTLGLAPVILHRSLFRQHAMGRIVGRANRILEVTLAAVALVLSGTVMLIFDVVVSRPAGIVAGVVTLAVTGLIWFLLPRGSRVVRS